MKTKYRSIAERFSLHIFIIIIAIASFTMEGCSYSSKNTELMDKAEMLMESYPDSALIILDSISDSDLHGRKQKAHYALLKTIALGKNHIKITDLNLLQPAIDFYYKHGTPDQKLKTYYYSGCIHLNAGKENLAMKIWLQANDLKGISDSLTLARLLQAKGILYHKQYKIYDYIKCNLQAAQIFGNHNKPKLQIKSYFYALNGSVILNNKHQADSIAEICRKITADNPEFSKNYNDKYLNYIVEYGEDEEIKEILNLFKGENVSMPTLLKLAKAYTKIGEPQKAMEYLNEASKLADDIKDSLSYLLIRSDLMDSIGNYRESKANIKHYAELLSKSDNELFSNELLFAEKKHDMEISMLMERQKRWNITWALLCGGFILLIILILILFRYRIIASKKKLAEQEIENLHIELERIEEERYRLEALLKDRSEMTPEMMNVIYERLDMLNSLLAKEITSNDSYTKPLIDSIRKDRAGFLDSTRVAFGISNPKFMNYLESHGLTEEEINYVCLYAMGLRGKEIGEYIQKKRHYVMGSGIRKKLGIDEHETNLGPYIRRLLKEL